MQGVAITQENSLLDNTARIEGWLARFPMFDWVGGRTSEMSVVGLLAAALHVFIFRFLMEFLLQGVLYKANINVFFRELTLKKCLLAHH